MRNERITLRLQNKHLDMLDEFIKEHDEFRSKSELCRIALDKYMKDRTQELKPQGVMVKMLVPAKNYEDMVSLVEGGRAVSIEAIINKLIDDHFHADVAERLKKVPEARLEIAKAADKPVIAYADREELIPR